MAVKREQVVQTAEKHVARGKIEAAIKEYKKLLADNPKDINTLNRVGDLYAQLRTRLYSLPLPRWAPAVSVAGAP